MSERLYYTDAYLTEFDAGIADRLEHGGRPAVVLDRTAFYPASGGQPYDTGTIAEVPVTTVIDLDDGRVLHVLERPIESRGGVSGRVDWTRRFDHMQQHTGQHVFSAAFERTHGMRTESFHLGTGTSTIDLTGAPTPEMVSMAERAANQIIWENRPVHVRFVDEAEASHLPLRKQTSRTGRVRIVEVDQFDLSACGGTHVARTGEIGSIAALGFERYKGGTRLEFVCGGRALQAYQSLRDAAAAAARALGTSSAEMPVAAERLQNDLKQQRQIVRDLQRRLTDFEVERLLPTATRHRGVSVVAHRAPTSDLQVVKSLAAAVAMRSGHVAILVAGDPLNVVVARAPDVSVDAAAIVRTLTARFGGRGGGRPEAAQAGGLAGDAGEILSAAIESL